MNRETWLNLLRWFDSDAGQTGGDSTRFNWLRMLPFLFLHGGCLLVLVAGVSATSVIVCVTLFLVRMFAITAFYHRYFAHKSFRTGRLTQFLFAVIGNTSMQRGALWWAAHHRTHHQHADQERDLHSPVRRGFWWSHVGWFSCDAGFKTDYSRINDWSRFPELVWLNRYDSLVPILYGLTLWCTGAWLEARHPALGTSGLQLLVWGFFISTVCLFHATVTINSLGHMWGKRRYDTPDSSRNNPWLALLTLGEGWHNNHHRWPASARQGFYWWEIDISWYLLKLMSWTGLIWDLRPVPGRVLAEGRNRERLRERRDE